ncbi:hypothetical protein BC939DRAFT_499414 [Gamsiella multidivaricata]|uniref:uncharacterized protein n=1 Tax=Gamsiella multidivaricata TaxID=101098 RepID=UPI0022209058|nr:uncharacterized protein BC939DRAFT_499414 [Gamsiella multidivaricata]KAG0357192.1 hypothetical protein BGZ54_000415 [Gamsiella multidivaricata]KAI7830702.1 hypothetical protein BC939DRAFT_499414 [Gamsiella multidivaricata]
MDRLKLPSRQSSITLQDITLDNWAAVTRLVVNQDQLGLAPSNLESLCEHQFHIPQSIVRAILADGTPIGYIRLQQEPKDQGQDQSVGDSNHSMFLLLSFMIAKSCQGLGFGTKAILLLQQEMRDRKGFKGIRVLTKPFATVHPEDSPEHFFSGLGFEASEDPGKQELIWIP